MCPALLLAALAQAPGGCGDDSESSGEIDADVDGLDAAAGADAEAADAGHDASTIDGDSAYEVTAESQVTPERGGDDGDAFSLLCASGFIATGIVGGAGARVDSLELRCREVLEDGGLGDDVDSTDPAGGDDGDAYELLCPDGEAIVAIRGRAGDDIDAIGIDCAPLAPWADRVHIHEDGDELVGGSGGDALRDVCSIGYFVAELSGSAGDVIHGLNARCDRVRDRDAPGDSALYERGAATEELPPRGGTDDRAESVECGDDELPIGYLGRADNRLDQLQLVCAQIGEGGGLEESGTSDAIGGDGGDEFELFCPEDEAIAGIRGAAGTEIDAIGLVCAPVSPWVERGAGIHPWARLRGGAGGDDFDDRCPPGMFLRDVSAALTTSESFEALTGTCGEVSARE